MVRSYVRVLTLSLPICVNLSTSLHLSEPLSPLLSVERSGSGMTKVTACGSPSDGSRNGGARRIWWQLSHLTKARPRTGKTQCPGGCPTPQEPRARAAVPGVAPAPSPGPEGSLSAEPGRGPGAGPAAAAAHPSARRRAEARSRPSVCFLANYCCAAAPLLIQ